jgi:hypothetical protein
MASSTVPSIDLDLAQGFPSDFPTVFFEMRLLNPRIGNFARGLKRDIVTAQCIQKCDVLLQGSPIWPEDVRYRCDWHNLVGFRKGEDRANGRTKFYYGPSCPHWLRGDPVPSLRLVRIGKESFQTIDDRIHLLELLSLRVKLRDGPV